MADALDAIEQALLTRLRQVFGDKRWVIAGEVAQGIAGGALALQSLGAEDVIAIASRSGVGALPDSVRFVMTDDARAADDASMVERMRENNRELHDLPAWVIAEIDEWDPGHQAQVVVSFTIDAGLVANRPTFGARPLDWAALEDKIAIRSLWADAGIETASDAVVDLANTDGLLRVHARLASQWGTVWAVDNEQGWHGGGKGTFWVSSPERARQLAGELAANHRRVRVQPFLKGVPCSIHAMVLAQETLAFRPCETIVLLDVANETFEYSRTATFWDPTDAEREQMRSIVRSVGDALREHVNYRGVFTLDGVLTSDGFRPTEVNPRFGAALPVLLPTTSGDMLPLFFMHLAAVTGNLDDLDATAIENLIVDRLDHDRAGTAFIFTNEGPPGGEQVDIALAGTWRQGHVDEIRVAGDDDEPFAVATWGQDPAGGLVFVTFTTAMPTGPAVAPVVVEVRRFLRDHWAIPLADLRPPFDG